MIDIPYLSQENYPSGCESVSSVMLLRFWGYDISVDEFIDDYLDKKDLISKNGELYGVHPNTAFIGNPRDNTGFGCYSPVIEKALNKIVEGKHRVVNLKGESLKGLARKYVSKGNPVLIWASINMMPTNSGKSWILEDSGEKFTWIRGEHCLVLIGYDRNYYYLADPYNGNGVVKYEKRVVEARYKELGQQAIGVIAVD